MAARIAELRELGYVEGPERGVVLTAAGRDALERLVAARRERLAELLDGWSPEREADLAALLTRMARDDRGRPSRRRSAGRRARARHGVGPGVDSA